jgi:putative peptidoglycan lipid II flippase
MIRTLFYSSLVVNLALLLGRLSGFGREVLVASTFGASAETDVVVLMLTVPDLLVNILMGGAMGAMLIPEFTQHPEQSRKLLYQSLLLFGVVFMSIAGLVHWQADLLVAVLAPGFQAEQVTHAAVVLGWVIWLIPLTVLAGIVTAYLHANNKFAVAALGTLIINCTIIVGLVLVFYGYGYLRLLAGFVLLGGILRLTSQLMQVRPGWSPLSSLTPFQITRPLLIRYGQAMLAGSVLLLFPAVARAFASFEGDGSLALINFATRLVEFPLAIAVTFLAVVFFPRLSQSFVEDKSLHRHLIGYGTQITIAISIIAAITLIAFGSAYAEFVYGYGDMPSSGVDMVAELTKIGLLALPVQGASVFLTSAFNSRKDTRTPMLINLFGLVFFVMSSLYGLFGEGLSAVMWGMVASYSLIFLMQLFFTKVEAFSWKPVLLDKTFLLGLVCAVVILVISSQLIARISFPPWLSLLLACVAALVSLCVMALFNEKLRTMLKTRLSAK